MFNPLQFKQKKKRPVDPNAPPRPNLLSHEKKFKENEQYLSRLERIIERQQDQIDDLRTKYTNLQIGMEQLISYMRKKR